ncbi:hypothetical protein [Neoaquamicrobium sediminum]|nr:hypothetical protein [Mesorhizobium sediminum]
MTFRTFIPFGLAASVVLGMMIFSNAGTPDRAQANPQPGTYVISR